MKTYTRNIVTAEQFTEEFTPEGVMVAPEEFIEKVLVSSIRKTIERPVYLLKLPKPSEISIEIAELFKVPFSFEWICKGDYVVTYPSGYAEVISRAVFEKEYTEIIVK